MERTQIERLNQLAKKAKSLGLTPDEINEQQLLRKEYIDAFRSNLKATLDHIVIVDEHGNSRKPKS